MINFYRKWKIVSTLRKKVVHVDKADVEEETGVKFGMPRKAFLEMMARTYLWGIPLRQFGEKWGKERMAKDKNLLRDLEEENPQIIRCRSVSERDNETLERFGITMERKKIPLTSSENNRIVIELTGKGYSYADLSNTIERFFALLPRISSLIVIAVLAIWGSNYLFIVKQIIKAWFCRHGIDILCG